MSLPSSKDLVLVPFDTRSRQETTRIVIHLLPNRFETARFRDIDLVFREMGILESPFHFIQTSDGEIHDSRDVKIVGGFSADSIDVAVLCDGGTPTFQQQSNLRDLVAALLQDYPEEKQLEVLTAIHEFRNTA